MRESAFISQEIVDFRDRIVMLAGTLDALPAAS